MAISNEQKMLKERIRAVLGVRRKTASDLGETDNEKKVYQRQILGDSLVTFDTIHKVLFMFHDVDANWLVLGEGQMQRTVDHPHIHNTTNEVNGSSAGGSIYVGTSTIPYPVQALLDEKDKRIAELEDDKRRLHTVIDALTVKPRK